MNISVIEFTCSDCQKQLHGHYKGLLEVSTQYGATCPNCNNQTFFSEKAAIMYDKAPNNSVKIIKVTNHTH